MSLFQRIRTPFREEAEDDAAQSDGRAHMVGDMLRERRQEFGLDLEQVGEALRIKPIYLAALEQGRTADLPGPTYAIGFVRAYANYLGLDGERVLDSYKAESVEVHARPDLSLPVPLGARSLPGGPVLLVAAILALCGYGTWYYLSTGDRNRPERVAAVPAALQQSAAAPIPVGRQGATATNEPATPPGSGPAPVPAPSLASGLPAPEAAGSAADGARRAAATGGPPSASAPPGVAAAPPAAPSTVVADNAPSAFSGAEGGTSGSEIDIKALADCWIQVRGSDQQIVFSRVLKAGETYRVPRPGLSLRTGNAGALAIAVDGKPAPAIGGVGVLRRDVMLNPAALLAGTAVHG